MTPWAELAGIRKQEWEGKNPRRFYAMLVLDLKVSLPWCEVWGSWQMPRLSSHPCWAICFPQALPPRTLLQGQPCPPGAFPAWALPTDFVPVQRNYEERIHHPCMGGVSPPGQSGPRCPEWSVMTSQALSFQFLQLVFPQGCLLGQVWRGRRHLLESPPVMQKNHLQELQK